MPKTTKGVTSTPPKEVAEYDWSQSAVTGFEGTRQEDLGMPFLVILQSGSPQIKKTDPNYPTKKIVGAGEGDIIDSLANAVVYTQGQDTLQFIPCFHERLYTEWAPRGAGGGFVKHHRSAVVLNETHKNEKGQDELKNGNLIVTTSYFYGLLLTEEEPKKAVIAMSSTQLKHARAWLNTASSIKMDGANGKFTPPFFSHAYAITTVPESNQHGSWFGYKVELIGPVKERELIQKCLSMARESATSSQLALPAHKTETEDNVPFA